MRKLPSLFLFAVALFMLSEGAPDYSLKAQFWGPPPPSPVGCYAGAANEGGLILCFGPQRGQDGGLYTCSVSGQDPDVIGTTDLGSCNSGYEDCSAGTQGIQEITYSCGTVTDNQGHTTPCNDDTYYKWADNTAACTAPGGGGSGGDECYSDEGCELCGVCGGTCDGGWCDCVYECSPINDWDGTSGCWCVANGNNDTGCCAYYDPIIIDVNGDGYSLTSAENGVLFDMAGTGQPVKFSWTAPGADDAFLAIDRNGNGRIDNGTELFSNFSPHAGLVGTRNGYNALSFYDKPENGGNGDGWIDKNDAIYSKLLLWIDKNHNGISEPGELYTLPQLGIARISLNYQLSRRSDAYGNVFRYRAQVVREDGNGPGKDHWAYDVLLHPK